MKRTFQTLGVFTETAFAGNPVAVVPDTDGLDGKAMQTIAREFNLSETVFLLPAEHRAHTAKARIFTPARELPFAGHPTVGTAIFLAVSKYGNPESEEDAILVLEEEIGPVRVGVRLVPGATPFAEFDAPELPRVAGEPAPVDRMAAALGLAPGDIGFENHRPVTFSAGVPFTFVPVRNLEAMGNITLALQHWPEAFGGDNATGAFVYCRETMHHDSAFHARMFAPTLGIMEDPATGAAAAAFAGAIMHFDAPHDGIHTRPIEQGYEMGRPSRIFLEIEVEGGKLHRVRIGGHAVPVMQGSFEF